MDAASGPSVEGVGEPGFGRLSRDSLVYSLGAFAGKAAALILVPILTRVLSTDDFGRLDVLSALTSALISVLLLGLDTAALRQFFALDDEGERSELVTTLLLLLLICTVPVCLVIVAFRTSISDWLFGTTSLDNAVALVAASVLGGIVLFGAQAVLRMERRPSGFAAVETLSLGAQAALVIVLVYAWERSVVAVMIGYAL